MLEKLLKKYPAGSDITILNTMYQYSKYNEYGVKQEDFLAITYKDNKTGIKDHIVIKSPEYDFYIANPGTEVNYNKLFVEKENVSKVTATYNKLEKKIAEVLNREAEYNDAINDKDKTTIRKLHADPRVFNSDQNIEDHYRLEFGKLYTNNIFKLHKAYYDIEVDIKDMVENVPGECPINAIALHDEFHDKIIQFLLRNPNNPLIEKYEQKWLNGSMNSNIVHDFVEFHLGGWKQMKRAGLENTTFEVIFFDDEIELLRTFFKMVYKFDPDFIWGWNSGAFDMEYIINRIIRLGMSPSDIMCDHEHWKESFVVNYVDNRHLNEFAERGDFTYIACHPVWMDQMIQFCSRRKAKMGSFTSFKLDDIGLRIAKVRKLDYSHITTNIADLPWLDFKTFSLYNFMDVIVQRCIENKAQDLDYIFAKCIMNNTSYKKGHRQTVYLINRMTKEWDKLGYIIGNNANRWNDKPDKFLGALVHDPLHTSDYPKIKIDGRPIMVCDNCQDYDFKSLYPSIILQFNIAPNTQIGYIKIWDLWCARRINRIHTKNHPKRNIDILYFPDNAFNKPFWIRPIQNGLVELYKDKEYKQKIITIPFDKREWETVSLEKVWNNSNIFNDDNYSMSGEFIENLVTNNLVEFCKRWLHLGGVKEVIEDLQEYRENNLRSFSSIKNNFTDYRYIDGKLIIVPFYDLGGQTAIKPFEFTGLIDKPFDIYKERNKGVNNEN